MANPSLRDGAVDKILTNFSIMYRNEAYISEEILPVVMVKERSGKFAKYGKDNLRIEDRIERAPGQQARSVDYSISQGSYVATEKAMEKIVPDEFVNNTDDPYDPKRDAVIVLLDKIWGHQEDALATTMADTSVLTKNATLSGTSQWSDYANSDPLGDIRTGKTSILQNTGRRGNLAVFGWQTWVQFTQHPDIVDRVKYVGTTDINAMRMAIANLLEVEEVIVGTAIKNTANEGQSDSLSFTWGKHFWLIFRPKTPSLMMPSFGYTIKDVDRVVDGYRDEPRKGDVVRVRDSYDQVIVDAASAYLIKDAVA